eukprot:1156285-Pelagomonas_calceolata.AAC.4
MPGMHVPQGTATSCDLLGSKHGSAGKTHAQRHASHACSLRYSDFLRPGSKYGSAAKTQAQHHASALPGVCVSGVCGGPVVELQAHWHVQAQHDDGALHVPSAQCGMPCLCNVQLKRICIKPNPTHPYSSEPADRWKHTFNPTCPCNDGAADAGQHAFNPTCPFNSGSVDAESTPSMDTFFAVQTIIKNLDVAPFAQGQMHLMPPSH